MTSLHGLFTERGSNANGEGSNSPSEVRPMTRGLRILVILTGCLVAGITVAAAEQARPEVELRQAMDSETIRGDLESAMQQYQAIADRYRTNNRVVASLALLRLAQLHERQGHTEAQRVYTWVVTEFADLPAAVEARAQLRMTVTPAGLKGERAVWTGATLAVRGRVSPDGRFIFNRDPGGTAGGIVLHDVAANVDRRLTPTLARWTRNAAFSSDSKQIAFEWWDPATNGRLAFRVAPLGRSGFLEPREVFLSSDNVLPNSLSSFDWSPDGKWIAAGFRLKDRTGQIALIRVANGSLTVLKSTEWDLPDSIFFSPDSRYIAYDLAPVNGEHRRDVFVMAIDGSREIPAVMHNANALMGWSPDGRHLLFSSDRIGATGLWALLFANGRVQGTPQLLKTDIGSTVSAGVTNAGALFVRKAISTRDVAIAPIDLTSGKLIGPVQSFTQGFSDDPRAPSWSPDGKYLAYSIEDGRTIAIRTVATGQLRLLRRTLSYVPAVDWSPDGRALLTRTGAADLKGRPGVFTLDAQTGEVTTVVLGNIGAAQWSRDGKYVYYFTLAGVQGSLLKRDVATGEESVVCSGFRADKNANTQFFALSPDGSHFAFQRIDGAAGTSTLLAFSAAGGVPRALLQTKRPEDLWSFAWTPDSAAVLVIRNTATDSLRRSQQELWSVPLDGPSRKLAIDTELWTKDAYAPWTEGFSVSPDGRHVAFVTGKTETEMWALENFLPSAATK